MHQHKVMGGFGATIKEGFALGIGIIMAERVLISLMGPLVIHHKTFASSTASATTEHSVTSSGALNACDIPSKDFVDCLNNNGSDVNNCQFYVNMLKECHRNTGASCA